MPIAMGAGTHNSSTWLKEAIEAETVLLFSAIGNDLNGPTKGEVWIIIDSKVPLGWNMLGSRRVIHDP